MAGGYNIFGPGLHDLVMLEFAVGLSGSFVAGLQKSASSAATEVVGFVGPGINKVFFTNAGLEHVSHVIGNRITKCFANQVAGILNGELDFKVLVPVRR